MERQFTEKELLSLNRDNFEKNWRLRGAREHFPCNKTLAELAESILFQQE